MTINVNYIDSFTINTSPTPIDGTFVGTVFAVQQKIMCKYTGKVLGVTQNIHFLETQAATSVFSVQQKVMGKQASYAPYQITQMIISP